MSKLDKYQHIDLKWNNIFQKNINLYSLLVIA